MNPEKELLLPGRPKHGKYLLVIHGGAGTMQREGSTPEKRALYTDALEAALRAGYEVLSHGGEAMDAAVAAVTVMEGQIQLSLINLVQHIDRSVF